MTNHPPCAVDQRPVHDAGNLCAACWADLEHDLSELAESLLHDLDITLAGLGRSGGSPIGIVVRSASRGVGFDERAGDLKRQLHNTLGGWVRVIHEDLPLVVECSLCQTDQRRHAEGPEQRPRTWLARPRRLPHDRIDCLAAWLAIHERQVRRHEAVGELWQEIRGLTEQARRTIDRGRHGQVYLGICSELLDDGYCAAELDAPEGRSTVICRECGAEHDVAQRREVMLKAMGGEKLTAAECSRAFATYGGYELKVERLRQWHRRRKIYQHPPRDGERWPRYRVAAVRRILDREIIDRKAS